MALIGNDYYKLRLTNGRHHSYEDIIEYTNNINEYFQWCIDNPLKEAQPVTYQGNGATFEVDKLRVFSIGGLCSYIGIAVSTFYLYEQREPDFSEITKAAKQIIENQQLEGAASGLLNPNIIALKLGLVKKTDITTDGEKIQQTQIFITPPDNYKKLPSDEKDITL
jgi:hypothetical protein